MSAADIQNKMSVGCFSPEINVFFLYFDYICNLKGTMSRALVAGLFIKISINP